MRLPPSRGNHRHDIDYAAKIFGIKATVIIPFHVPAIKESSPYLCVKMVL